MERTEQHETIERHAAAAREAIQGIVDACSGVAEPVLPYVRDYALGTLGDLETEVRAALRKLPGM